MDTIGEFAAVFTLVDTWDDGKENCTMSDNCDRSDSASAIKLNNRRQSEWDDSIAISGRVSIWWDQ